MSKPVSQSVFCRQVSESSLLVLINDFVILERIENYLESEEARMRAEGVRPIEIENEKLKIINDFKANDFFYNPSQISK